MSGTDLVASGSPAQRAHNWHRGSVSNSHGLKQTHGQALGGVMSCAGNREEMAGRTDHVELYFVKTLDTKHKNLQRNTMRKRTPSALLTHFCVLDKVT